MGISIKQLEYFVAVTEAGSITRAAEQLHVTPTAISLQIRLFEDLVGSPLLKRHSRGIVPTPIGDDLLVQASQILAMVAKLERAFLRSETMAQEIRLGAPPAFTRLIGVEAIEGAATWLGTPNLTLVEGWTHELELRLQRHELDCMIGWELPRHPEVHITPLLEDYFYFVCAPTISSGAPTITLKEVLASPLVFYGKNSASWRVAQKAAQSAGLKMDSDRHVESIAVWRSLLCRGLGTSIVSTGSIRDEYMRGELVIQKIIGYTDTRMVEVAVRIEHKAEPWAFAISDFLKNLMLQAQSAIPVAEPSQA